MKDYQINAVLTDEQIQKLNAAIDELLLGYPGGVTHRTRGEFIGKLKEKIKSLGIKGDSWLPEIMKLRDLK